MPRHAPRCPRQQAQRQGQALGWPCPAVSEDRTREQPMRPRVVMAGAFRQAQTSRDLSPACCGPRRGGEAGSFSPPARPRRERRAQPSRGARTPRCRLSRRRRHEPPCRGGRALRALSSRVGGRRRGRCRQDLRALPSGGRSWQRCACSAAARRTRPPPRSREGRKLSRQAFASRQAQVLWAARGGPRAGLVRTQSGPVASGARPLGALASNGGWRRGSNELRARRRKPRARCRIWS